MKTFLKTQFILFSVLFIASFILGMKLQELFKVKDMIIMSGIVSLIFFMSYKLVFRNSKNWK